MYCAEYYMAVGDILMENNNMIEVSNLTKKFGKFTAVDDISFSVRRRDFRSPWSQRSGEKHNLRVLSTLARPTAELLD